MNPNLGFACPWRPAILLVAGALLGGVSHAASVTWDRNNDMLACKRGDSILWQFSYATNQGKPFFHPLRAGKLESVTAFQPVDHPWHYGLWFSWKYINGVNYWEEDKKTHRAQGRTAWGPPNISTRDDGSALIQMQLEYISPTNGVVLTEARTITISAPSQKDEVTIDWTGSFKAGKEPLVLDRTPMPGEPHGAVNGGYAGLSLRAAQKPAICDFVTCDGAVTKFESDRARPRSPAAACNITLGGEAGGVAIVSALANLPGPATWYIIHSDVMRWFSPALLSPAPKQIKSGEAFTWHFQVATKAGAWSPEELRHLSETFEARLRR